MFSGAEGLLQATPLQGGQTQHHLGHQKPFLEEDTKVRGEKSLVLAL